MKPKLLVLTTTFPRWPNDADPPFVYNLSKRLTRQFDVTVHTPHYPGAKTRELLDGMHIHRFRYNVAPLEKLAGSTGILPTLRVNKIFYVLVPFLVGCQFFSLLFLVRKLRPDIIHAHWLIPQGLVAIIIKRVFRTPVVVTAHGADIFGLQGMLMSSIKNRICLQANRISVVSRSLQQALKSSLPNQSDDVSMDIIPMGTDAKVFSPEKKNDDIRKKYGIKNKILLFVGRLTEKKGVDYLIDAMPMVLKQCPDTRLLIIGNGERADVLKRQAASYGLFDSIDFLGSIPNSDLPAYYATADIFIAPSITAKGGDTEGFGLTLVEAAMSGCLVISTKTGGIEDIIQDGKTGFLVPQKDAKDLAEKIMYSFAHKDEIDKMREAGRIRCIEKFDWSVIAGRYEELLMQAAMND